jgi:hypothetical protein
VWGAQQQTKYDWLDKNQIESTAWTTLSPAAPHYLFIPQDTKRLKEYQRGWKVTEIMPVTVIGPNSHRDNFAIAFDCHEAEARLTALASGRLSAAELLRRFEVSENENWSLEFARRNLPKGARAIRCLYRPFDQRFMLWGQFIFDRPREELMRHLIDWEEAASSTSGRRKDFNLALIATRQTKERFSVFATRIPVGQHKLATPYDGSYVSPLYLYSNGSLPEEDLFAHEDGRRPNLSAEFIQDFCEKLDVKFVPDGLGRPGKREVGPELIFHYAYAVFHSPTYRERYADFLRADFPRLPLTGSLELFRILASLGGYLVDLHARGKGEPRGLSFPVKGDNVIAEARYQPAEGKELSRVWINNRQYFDGVPERAWTFPIGGYLPAQRWLKDRIGRPLAYEEQAEYQRIVWALLETRRFMQEIDEEIEGHGGWPLK